MDMYNWLSDCYEQGILTVEEIEIAINNEYEAFKIWQEFSNDSEFGIYCQEQLREFKKIKMI